MPAFRPFEDRPITAKISLAVAALVFLTLAVSLTNLYGLRSMERTVDAASRSAEMLAAVNAATGRVENFIATRDQSSLYEAESMVATAVADLSDVSAQQTELLTGSLDRLAAAIAALRAATLTMDAETENMTSNYTQMRGTTILIEQGIVERQKALDSRIAAHAERMSNFENAHRILDTVRGGERTATASVAQVLAGSDAAAAARARIACAALPPLVAMLRETIDAPDQGNALDRLAAAVAAARRAIESLAESPAASAGEALRHLAAVWQLAERLEGLVNASEERSARERDDIQTEAGLLRNASALSKRFAERVATLEAQTLAYRLSPTTEIAQAVAGILDELNRLSRVLPSTAMLQANDAPLSVVDKIAGYRSAFATFTQAGGALREAHDQVRNEARTAGQLVARFAGEERSAAAVHKDRSVLAALLAGAVAILLAGAIAWHTSRLVAHPIVKLASVMRRLAAGELDAEIAGLGRGDEIGIMTRAVKVFQENSLRVRAFEAEAETERTRIQASLEKMVAERTEALLRQTEVLETQAVELTRARVQAEAATTAKSEFLAGMSHELRTPLNAVLGYAQLLQRDPSLGEGQVNAVNTIRQSGDHLLTLINDLLDLAKIEASKFELYPAPISLGRFLAGIADIIRLRIEEKGVTFAFECAEDLPDAVIVDEKRLRQVLLNLLSNAVKFTDRGTVGLFVRVLGRDDAGVRLQFEVSDTGIGIAPEQIGIIFNAFEQVGAREHRAAGTGLGLAISRALVRLMGDDIRVESRLGEGSRFWFDIAVAVGADTPTVQPKGRAITGYSGPRRAVLVVDDVAENRALLATLFSGLGFDVREAADGGEAVARVMEIVPDIAIMDGVEAVRHIRAIPAASQLPIIIASTSAGEADRERSVAAGADLFLPKPIDVDVLLEQLGRLLGLVWEHAASPHPDRPPPAVAAPIVFPSREDMATLHDLARAGSMKGIRDWAAHLEERDPCYQPLANHLRDLASNFQSKAILALVEKNLPGEECL